jgi:hypothetical protein
MHHHDSTASLRSLLFVFSTLPLLSACPVQADGDDEIGDSESTDVDVDAETDSEESDSDTSDDGDDSSETGEPDSQAELCQQWCDAWYPCFNDGPQDGSCVASCLEDFFVHPAGACLENDAVLLSCLATLTCEEYEAYLWHEEGEAFPCEAENESSCQCLESVSSVTEGQTTSDCALEYECVGEIGYAVECTSAGCICYEDGVEAGGCANAVETCTELVGTNEYAQINACCGWSLE